MTGTSARGGGGGGSESGAGVLALKPEAAAVAAAVVFKPWRGPKSPLAPERGLLLCPAPLLNLLLGGSPRDAPGPEPPAERPRLKDDL